MVLLEAGDPVPADGRLFVAASLEADESALTGESQPVGKQLDSMSTADVPLAERSNMLYINTLLARGRAEMIVTATGMQTEMGRMSKALAATTEVPIPMQVQLDQLGKHPGAIALTLVGLLRCSRCCVATVSRTSPWARSRLRSLPCPKACQ